MVEEKVSCPICNTSFSRLRGPKGGRPKEYCSETCRVKAASRRRRESRHALARATGNQRVSGRPPEYVPRPEVVELSGFTYDAQWYAKNQNGLGYFHTDFRGGSVELKDGRVKPVSSVSLADLREYKIKNLWNPTTRQFLSPDESGDQNTREEDDSHVESQSS